MKLNKNSALIGKLQRTLIYPVYGCVYDQRVTTSDVTSSSIRWH